MAPVGTPVPIHRDGVLMCGRIGASSSSLCSPRPLARQGLELCFAIFFGHDDQDFDVLVCDPLSKIQKTQVAYPNFSEFAHSGASWRLPKLYLTLTDFIAFGHTA